MSPVPRGYLYGFWHVDDDSWLRDLIYGRERWLVSRYKPVSEPGNTKAGDVLRVTARLTDGTWGRGCPSLEDASALFTQLRHTDPAEPLATTELPLEDVVEPTADDIKALPPACRRLMGAWAIVAASEAPPSLLCGAGG